MWVIYCTYINKINLILNSRSGEMGAYEVVELVLLIAWRSKIDFHNAAEKMNGSWVYTGPYGIQISVLV